jgi:hypothetical protein
VAAAEIRVAAAQRRRPRNATLEILLGELPSEEYYQDYQDNQSPQKEGIAA